MSNWGWIEKLERFWRSSVQGLKPTPTEEFAVDLGTANTRIYLPGEGIVIDEPSLIALHIESNEVVAVGQEAKTFAWRQPREIRVMRPIKEGVIADCEVAGKMLSQFIKRALTDREPAGLSLLICVPADITPLEQKAYEDAARCAGAEKVTLIEGPYAAAAGADLNLRSACSCMIVDLGAGTTDIAVISGGSVLYGATRRVGGVEIDRAIARYLHLERTLEVGEETAEDIKIKLGIIDARREQRAMAVRGRNLTTGLPEEITITSEEIHPLILPTLRLIKQHVNTALEEISTGASVDLLDSGVTLSGGLSQLTGLAEHLGQELRLHVRVASNPMLAAVLGAGRLLEQESQASTQGTMKEQESAGW
ncbi:MAG: rod shape-determining protein [Acidobacteria bacterium]|nr:rod shape-determining protein [Acidobacteriota bacterium]